MKVTFQIEGGSPVQIECNAGDNLLELARRANVAIDAPCSGNGSCGKCRVKLLEGDLDTIRSRHISDEEYNDGWRLSLTGVDGSVEDCGVMEPLAPISASHPRFAGRMTYEREVELEKAPAAAVLEAEWLYETADLFVDDRLAATRLTPPYRFDLSEALHPGVNKLRIEVAVPPVRDALKHDLGPFSPNRNVLEPTGMFGEIRLKLD